MEVQQSAFYDQANNRMTIFGGTNYICCNFQVDKNDVWDVSLPAQLKRFVEKKVKDGLYPTESDVVCDALRGLRERDHLLRGNAIGVVSAFSRPNRLLGGTRSDHKHQT